MEKRLDIDNRAENALTRQDKTRQDKTRQDKTRQDKTRQILIVGTIGNTERQNRDNMRVISGKGLMYALKAHIDKEQPMVLKKYSKFIRH